MNDEWLRKRVDRLLRPENNPDGMDVIELEWRECDECDDKQMMNVEYMWMINDYERETLGYWDQKTLQMGWMW